MTTRVLVVDDEPQLADLIARHLSREGYETASAIDGIAALTLAANDDFDLAIVDANLPGMNGFELCRRLRQQTTGLGILMLTARDAIDDRVRGLDAGADDYLIKPFDFAELYARLRALRRREGLTSTRIQYGDLTLSTDRGILTVAGRDHPLSRREADLLRVLAEHPGSTVSRADLLTDVWGSPHFQSNVVDQYVRYVRRKLTAAGSEMRIDTERGVGFRLTDPRQVEAP
ncbi:response regulator transcription factor [Microbacterium sp. NPDC057650]|uniref:response regulator transcription factor n=1 Tax=unclassified Microbacterium TaxID=2609290 RepID=UPI00366E63E5